MKPIVLGFLVSAMLSGVAAADEQPDSILKVTTSGRNAESFAGSKDLAVRFWFQQLAISALYRNDVESASSADWERAAESPSRIHCSYPANSHMALPERELLTFEEIVVPIPERGYPDFIYLKHGESHSRLAKYDPWLFWKLKVEVGIAGKVPDSVDRALF